MENQASMILAIDISSNSVKVGLVSEDLKLDQFNSQNIKIINEDIDGFVKSFDMNDLWNKITIGVNQILNKIKNRNIKIMGISICTQRIASVFLDGKGSVVYGGPNIDIRGIDSAYLIEDEFSEKDLVPYLGGEVLCSEYGEAGSEELADNVKTSLEERNAVILANHGSLCCGSHLEGAYTVLQYLERGSKIYYLAKLIKEPNLLPEDTIDYEMDIFDLFKDSKKI